MQEHGEAIYTFLDHGPAYSSAVLTPQAGVILSSEVIESEVIQEVELDCSLLDALSLRESEALQWAVRIGDGLSDVELSEFGHWLRIAPEHHAAYEAFANTIDAVVLIPPAGRARLLATVVIDKVLESVAKKVVAYPYQYLPARCAGAAADAASPSVRGVAVTSAGNRLDQLGSLRHKPYRCGQRPGDELGVG